MVSELADAIASANKVLVLILVLVEDGLGVSAMSPDIPYFNGLNPCFSGGWSRSVYVRVSVIKTLNVLILVLVEDGLGADGTVIANYNRNLS